MNNRSDIERLQRQQGALADFGTFAFREDNLQTVLMEAARICAQSLDVSFAKICRYRPEEDDLFVVAGCGWHGVVGQVVSKADESSTQGRAFITGEPVILEDISQNGSFALAPFYAAHSITSTADVLIQSKEGGSWGVLEVDSTEVREFDRHDIVFLTGFANVIAEAVVTSERTVAMRGSIDQMTRLIAEKDALLIEREQREKELRELQSELLHVSRLNAMGQMTAAIAHELNQPLAAIANYVGAAKLSLATAVRTEVTSHAQGLITKAGEQTIRAGEVIKKLRDMVEKRENIRVGENLDSIVKSAVNLVLFGSQDAGIAVTVAVADALPKVLIDKVQIQQIVCNLVRNSVEAMRNAERRELDVSIALGDLGFVDVTVRDTGTGMPTDVSSRLFLPFVTTKSDGMGLGLVICRTLVEANGGRIWRLADISPGTAFRFSLPIAIAPDGVLPLVA